ncbi:hypothetical protein LCY76_22715 [Fictibacillus sp. KIGAM418]|uniref:Uncharacterized protein n=1 Tax=Fictibacillus marinisediminis TaxID=2878389 RepID=A0A9X1XGT0_9BACL|nr:hypothetical protein [Fictibacillus marinisediminis]MCK6259388.1 hypothetical protein [Fictibacillus marinisediminis]
MFETVNQTPKEIIFIYIVFMAACFVTYPLIRLITTAMEKGLNKWR